MKKLILILAVFFPVICSAGETTKTVFNPFTGKFDYITSLDSFNGVNISSGFKLAVPSSALTGNTTLTSTMSVVTAICSTPTVSITLTLPPASSATGNEILIYNVGVSSCSIKVAAAPGEVIEGTGTISLDAKYQHASLHSLGNSWGSGLGGIQYTPWTIFTTQDDVGLFSVAIASQVTKCPIYIPVPIALTAFRINRESNNGAVSAAVFDMNGKYIIGVSTQQTVNQPKNYLLNSVYNLSPGWYYIGVSLNNTTVSITGSNAISGTRMFCGVAASPTHMDLSQVTLGTGVASNATYPAVDLIFNGGLQGF